MRKTVRLILAAAILMISFGMKAARPEIAFTAEAVAFNGLSAGTRVAWLAVVREPRSYSTSVYVLHGTGIATPSGVVSIPARGAEVTNALWMMVEFETGATVRTSAPGYTTSVRSIDIRATNGDTFMTIVSPQAKVLYVRPRHGVWYGSAYDGGAGDDDRESDARIHFSLSSLRGVHGNPHPPAALEPGDVLLVIDPVAMRTSRIEVVP